MNNFDKCINIAEQVEMNEHKTTDNKSTVDKSSFESTMTVLRRHVV